MYEHVNSTKLEPLRNTSPLPLHPSSSTLHCLPRCIGTGEALHLDHSTWITQPGPLHLDHSTWTTPPGPLHLDHSTWTTPPGPLHLDHSTWITPPGPLHLEHSTWITPPGTLHLDHSTWTAAADDSVSSTYVCYIV